MENQNIAAHDSTSIYFFDNELNLLNTLDVASPDYITDVVHGDSSFSVLCGENLFALGNKVKTYNYDFSELGNFELDFDQISWRGIGLKNGEIIIAGREIYGMDLGGSVVKSFYIDGSTENYMQYVALYDLAIDSVGSDTLIFYGPRMTLENNGIDTLHSIWISVLVGYTPPFICRSREIISYEFTGLPLSLGESMGLELPDLFFKDAVENEIDLCYYAHLPNRHMDIDYSDNFTCLEFFVNSEEPFFEDIGISIYPNPGYKFLNIKTGNYFSQNMEVYILNNYGQVVTNITLEKGNTESKIEIDDWPSGVYYLKIIHGEEVFAKQFIKQ